MGKSSVAQVRSPRGCLPGQETLEQRRLMSVVVVKQMKSKSATDVFTRRIQLEGATRMLRYFGSRYKDALRQFGFARSSASRSRLFQGVVFSLQVGFECMLIR